MNYTKTHDHDKVGIQLNEPVAIAYLFEDISADKLGTMTYTLETGSDYEPSQIHNVYFELDRFGVILITLGGKLTSGVDSPDYYDSIESIVCKGDIALEPELESIHSNTVMLQSIMYGTNEDEHKHLANHSIHIEGTKVTINRVTGEGENPILSWEN